MSEELIYNFGDLGVLRSFISNSDLYDVCLLEFVDDRVQENT
jgi:hypothetical protein